MGKRNENLNNTTSVSRSERKAMERAMEEEQMKDEEQKKKSREEKNKDKNEEKEVKEILKAKEPLKPLEEEFMENTQSIKAIEEEKLQVGELGKTQHFLNMTSEITTMLGDNAMENLFEEKKEKSSFNPITWIGLLIVGCFGFFIYLVIRSGYEEELLLLIDSGFLLGITLLFGISIITGTKGTKVLSILNLLAILSYVGINIFFLYDWNQTAEEKKVEEPPIEEKKETKQYFVCTSKDSLKKEKITVEKDTIKKLERNITISDKEELEKLKELFKEENGMGIQATEDKLILTFDFETLDINQYKVIMREYLDFYRTTSDFLYVEEESINFNTYKETELKDFECVEEKEES